MDYMNSIEVHLPSGEVSPLDDVIAKNHYALDVNLSYFREIVDGLIHIDSTYKDFWFLLTRNVESLPDFSDEKRRKLIVVSLGDEWGRVPHYAEQVFAVFKCYGSDLKLSLHRADLILNLSILIQFARSQSKRLKTSKVGGDNVFPLPLGFYRQVSLPTTPILERSADVAFIGSLRNSERKSLLDSLGILRSPKTVSRSSMASYALNWSKQRSYTVDIGLTSRFLNAGQTSKGDDCSERLMDSKICLCPRGTSLETFRYFEALRYGCVLISEPVPDRWFYRDSPAIYINDWKTLPAVLDSLLGDKDRLVALHQQALDWWQSKCAPAAVSAKMDSYLKSDSRP